ncbi:Ig-like domain-containing protein, partial [Niabella drilacis]
MKKKIQQMYRASLLMTLLLFSVVTVWAQATIPFGCSSKGYQVMIVSGSNPVTYSFDSYDIKTGIQSQLFNFPAGVSVNALGYNPTDNYMYTYKGGNQLYKIGADGYTAMTIAGLPATNPDPTAPTIPATGYNMADITDDGYMLLANSSSNRYYYVDLNPARPATYGKLVDPDTGAASTAFNTFTGGGTTLAVQYAGDVAYNKADGMFYTVVTYTAVSPNTYQLRKIDPVSGAVTAIGAVTGTPSNSTGNGYGSLFFDATGTLYGFFNPAGRYYSIPITGTGSRAATQVGGSYNPNSTNDGAMCPNTVLNYVNISGKVNNLNTGSGTNLGGQLYATLVDANGKVVDQVPVNADGTYTLAGSPNASYQVVITTTPATKGAAAPAPNLPPDWKNVRDGVGAANDGSANGSLSITTGTGDFSNANFDIQQMTVNPDFNSGYVNQTIKGNLNTNDKVPGTVGTTTTYGSPAVVGTNPSSDMPTINPDGTYTFTGTKPGVYTFDVPVCAGSVCVNNRLTITVAEPNSATNPPVANPDLATMTGYPVGGTPTSVTLNTLANDQPGSLSPALNPASVTPTQPAHGTVTKDALGNITYTPDPGFVGKDTIPYQVCDLSVPTPKCTSSYQVVTVNAPGTANSTSASDDYATAVQGASIVRTAATGLKANDVDPEGNATTITGIGGTAL